MRWSGCVCCEVAMVVCSAGDEGWDAVVTATLCPNDVALCTMEYPHHMPQSRDLIRPSSCFTGDDASKFQVIRILDIESHS